MSARRKSFEVRRNNARITVYPWNHPTTGAARWRFAWRADEKSPWRYLTKKTKAEAEKSAWEILGKVAGGGMVWEGIDLESRRFLEDVHRLAGSADRLAVLAFLENRSRSAEIVASVERFVIHKGTEAGEETPHLIRTFTVLREMAKHFAGRQVVEIHAPDLLAWWTDRGKDVGSKRRRDLRSTLVHFWNWCQREGLAGTDPVTVAERLPSVKAEDGERRVLTVDEVLGVLGAIEKPWRGWAVLGAFAGLRPEEACPAGKKKKRKRGLLCEDIDWTFRVIRLPGEVSKVKRPRVIPMSGALIAWLEWAGIKAGMTGPVCLVNPSDEKETGRLGKLVFKTGWPQDALRHSYGSYRNAIVRSLPQVAEEMGTSVTMLQRHYHNPRATEQGEEWFDLRPEMIRCDPMISKSGRDVKDRRLA